MKRSLLCLGLVLFLLPSLCFAAIKTWNGGASGSWGTAGNWSPSGVPSTVSGDSIVFDGSLWPTITISDVAAYTSAQSFGQFTARNNVTLNLSGPSNTYLYFSGGIQINFGCIVNIGAATTTLFVFGGNTTTAGSTLIAGTLEMKGTGISNQKSFQPYSSFTFNAVAKITGSVILSGSFATIVNSNTGNLSFENGSFLDITRDGGSLGAATHKDGSTIRIKGVNTSLTSLNSSSIYNGVIIWDCASQTVSGSSATMSLSSSYTIDSFVVKNTGTTGTVRLSTDLNSVPNISFIRVEGGKFEIASPRAGNRIITLDTLEVAGGECYLNATDATDVGLVYIVTVTVNYDVTVSGGTLFMSNRPNGTSSTYGTGNIRCRNNFIQTGGLITESSPIPPISDASVIYMDGTVAQNLKLTNWTNEVRLSLDNTTNGVTLQSNITCPELLIMYTASAFAILGNYDMTVTYNNFFRNTGGTLPARFITNGFGKFKVLSIPPGTFYVFPVAYNTTTYNPVIVFPQPSAATNSYYVRVENGNNPAGIFNTGKTINRTWIINAATAIAANSVTLTFQEYTAADANGSCIPSAPMELGHFVSGSWSLDPTGITRTPIGSDPYSVGAFAPNSLDSAFVLGNEFSILALKKSLTLTATKLNTTALLHWNISSIENIRRFVIEHSTDGRQFAVLHSLDATTAVFYNWQHIQTKPGINYYRIKMIGADERAGYSNVSTVLNSSAGAKFVSIVPNIIANKSSAVVNAAKAFAGSFVITDLAGNKTAQFSVMLSAGENIVQLPVTLLKAGIYHVALITDNDMQVQRFIKL